jgi:hypothetical protein
METSKSIRREVYAPPNCGSSLILPKNGGELRSALSVRSTPAKQLHKRQEFASNRKDKEELRET